MTRKLQQFYLHDKTANSIINKHSTNSYFKNVNIMNVNM